MRKTALYLLTALLVACLMGCGRKSGIVPDMTESPPPAVEPLEAAPAISASEENASQKDLPEKMPSANVISGNAETESEPISSPVQPDPTNSSGSTTISPSAAPGTSVTSPALTAPSATEAPVPAASPSPKPVSTPAATAVPTASPRPTPTPLPAATPVPTTTPRATATPAPPATPKPTDTPRPTATPRSTATPAPAPTLTPKPTPTATPKPTATQKPAATPTTHTHSWVTESIPETGHFESRLIGYKDGDPIYDTESVWVGSANVCNVCGAEFTYAGGISDHFDETGHNGYHSRDLYESRSALVGYEQVPEYEDIWIIDTPAFSRTYCSDCGVEK